MLVLAILLLQDADEIIAQLEEKAAAARGFELRAHLAGAPPYGDERVVRACADARIEVSHTALWREGWALWLGPERQASSLVRDIALYTARGPNASL